MSNSIYDVPRLRDWHAHIAALAGVTPPEVRIIGPPQTESRGDTAVIAGSFNPATNAHLSLCHGMLQQANIDVVWFLLAIHTVDKEEITGAGLEDRLCILEMLVAARPNVGIVLCNRGLYVEQATALRNTLVPAGRELVFAVGYDKIQQILDPRYYADREASLDQLFSLSRFLVAERGAHGVEDLVSLLEQEGNRTYRQRIMALTTLPAYHDPALSSTGVRAANAQGAGRAMAEQSVPGPVQAFIETTGVYASPVTLSTRDTVDRYQVRLKILEALFAEPESDFSPGEFRAAISLASNESDSGQALRRLLAQDCVSLNAIRHRLGL